MSTSRIPPTRRADAQRNRDRILEAARAALDDHAAEVSMAEVARRAGVGMATLYRNFADRRTLLEALYTEQVDALTTAAAISTGSPGEAFSDWLRRFAAFHETKHPIAVQLLQHAERTDPVFDSSRDRVLRAGRPLLAAAQQHGEVRDDVTLEQVLDLVLAVSTITGGRDQTKPMLQVVLDGLRA